MKDSNQRSITRVQSHMHCRECGKVISASNDYCSPDCETEGQNRIKDIESMKFSMRIIIILVAFALIINLFIPMLFP